MYLRKWVQDQINGARIRSDQYPCVLGLSHYDPGPNRHRGGAHAESIDSRSRENSWLFGTSGANAPDVTLR